MAKKNLQAFVVICLSVKVSIYAKICYVQAHLLILSCRNENSCSSINARIFLDQNTFLVIVFLVACLFVFKFLIQYKTGLVTGSTSDPSSLGNTLGLLLPSSSFILILSLSSSISCTVISHKNFSLP